MIASIALVLLVTVSGALATYLYDERASIGVRLCAGVCLGLASLGMIGFVAASFLGLARASIVLSAVLCAAPFIVLFKQPYRKRVNGDLFALLRTMRTFTTRPDIRSIGYVVFYVVIAIVLWRVFSKAMIVTDEGISTGLLNNFGDLPFHLSVITGFSFGNNFPPEDPTYAGVRFTYPFISDFISAEFVSLGANLRNSMFLENFVVAFAFVGLLHRWALVMLRDRLAAVITPLLVLLNGGFGFVLLFNTPEYKSRGFWAILNNFLPSFTVIPETTWRWGNAISALLIPQRGFLLGLPLAVIAFTGWWIAIQGDIPLSEGESKQPQTKRKSKKSKTGLSASTNEPGSLRALPPMIAAGVAAGLLPLVHAHSFVVVMGMASCIALLTRRWREWFWFFALASIIAIPQLLWSTSHSAVKASSFFGLEFGWDHGEESPVWFWFKNTGLFIPLVIVALLWRGKHPLLTKLQLFFYLPFTLCFIVPNCIKMAPWIWDNIKVLYYWWVASSPIVALVLARIWRDGLARHAAAAVLFVCLVLAGTLDVAGIALRSVNYTVFDVSGIKFADLVKHQTPPNALIVHAPVHNDPVFLTGRRSLMGYPGHIWTHGLDFAQRESEIRRIYAGDAEAQRLIDSYRIQYVVVGPLERNKMLVNDQFFAGFQKVGQIGEYSLYKTKTQ
ncbi:MAG: hypothetical protein ABR555_10745 [Pyrinomonadaceae bacterium]